MAPRMNATKQVWARTSIPPAPRADEMQVGGNHYKAKAVQPWAVMQSCMSKEEFVGFLRGNVIKYTMRCNDKGGIEDLAKAQHYLAKLLEVLA